MMMHAGFSVCCGMAALSLGLLSGCPASDSAAPSGGAPGIGGSGGSGAATFTSIYEMIFPRVTNAHCDMCHGLPAFDASNGNWSTGMDKASTYKALMGATSTSSMCMNRPFVVPGQPDMSLFLQKVKPNPPCGLRMPNGGAPLSDAQIEMIRSWIAAGAKDD